MQNLYIHNTPKTPQIDFNLNSGEFLISGVSVPENSLEFYGEIIKWLKEYIKTPVKNTNVIFKLTYVNTSSLQFIYDLLMILDGINSKTSTVDVTWYYFDEDSDMKEMGEDFRDALSINFSFCEVETV